MKHAIKLLAGMGLFATAAFAALSAPARVPYLHARSYYESHVDLAAPERARIQAHLEETEAHLRAHPPAGLSAEQMRNRFARLDDLHAYWTRGEFPKNRDFPDRLVPYFIDAEGVPCAMAYLVIQSSGREFAEEIRATRNNAYIAEIAAADRRLATWAKEQGLTLEEAARVQPGYGPPSLASVTQVRLDSLARPWVFGPDKNTIGGTALFYRDSSTWKFHSAAFGASGFCVTRSGHALVFDGNGTRQGLVRLRRGGPRTRWRRSFSRRHWPRTPSPAWRSRAMPSGPPPRAASIAGDALAAIPA